eukprot:m.110697 g.110697  ORF g.110697 m.110697 type:complete len:78 (+) comp14048_c0_seq2:239-472(+)
MYVYYVKYYVTLPCALTELYGVSVCVLCMCVTTSDLKLYKTVNCFSYFFKLVEKARGYLLCKHTSIRYAMQTRGICI